MKQVLLLVGLIVLLCSADAVAQKKVRVEQRQIFNCDERNDWKDYLPGNIDWVVYFTYPSNGTDIVVEARGESESAVLRQSTKDFNFYARGQRYVKVITGYRARKAGNYKSSRQAWANSLRLVYYAPFEPRGPSGPRRP
jgi:hypothetical protein